MNIKEVREKFPQYNDLSDTQLADALHAKFYSDIPKPAFYSRIGLTTGKAAPTPEPAADADYSSADPFMTAIATAAAPEPKVRPTSVLEGVKAPAPLPTEDPLLRPEFVRGVERRIGALPAEQRAEALSKLAQRKDVYGRAARVVQGRTAAMEKAGEVSPAVAGVTDPRLETQVRKLIDEGGMAPDAAEAYARQELEQGRIPRVLPKMRAPTGAELALEQQAREYEVDKSATGIEAAIKSVQRLGKTGELALGRAGGGMQLFIGEMLGADVSDVKDKLNYISAYAREMGENPYLPLQVIESAGSSIVQQLPALVAGAITGSGGLALTSMYANSFGDTYADGRNRGLDKSDSTARAAIYAAFEVLGERFGLKESIGGLKAAANRKALDEIIPFFSSQLKKNIAGEELTYAGQFATDKGFGLNPEAGFADFLKGAAETALVAATQTGMMLGGAAATSKTLRTLDKSMANYALAKEISKKDFEQAAIDEYARRALSPEFYSERTVVPGVPTERAAPEAQPPAPPAQPPVAAPTAERVEPTFDAEAAAAVAAQMPAGRAEPTLEAPAPTEETRLSVERLMALGLDPEDAQALVEREAAARAEKPAAPVSTARLEDLTDEYIAAGLPPEQARALAIKRVQQEEEADKAAEGEARATKPVSAPSGEGAGVAGVSGERPAAGRPARAKRTGVVSPAEDVGQPAVGEGEQFSAVTAEGLKNISTETLQSLKDSFNPTEQKLVQAELDRRQSEAAAPAVAPVAATTNLRELNKSVKKLYEGGEEMSVDDLRLTKRKMVEDINDGLATGKSNDEIVAQLQKTARGSLTDKDVAAVQTLLNDKRGVAAETKVEAEAESKAVEEAKAPTKTADDLYEEIRALKEQQQALLRKDGLVPFVNSPARKKYDELGERVDLLMPQWSAADTAERKAKKEAKAETEKKAEAPAETERTPTDRQQRVEFGKALGAVQPYPGTLKGRVNLPAQKAAIGGDFAGVVSALEKSKNATVAEVGRRAKGLGTKIVIDEEAIEEYQTRNRMSDQMSIDGAKMHLEALDKLREIAPKVAKLKPAEGIPFELANTKITPYQDGEVVPYSTLSLRDIVKNNNSMFAPLGLPEGSELSTKRDFDRLLKAFEDLTSSLGEDKLRLTATASAISTGVAAYYDADTDTIHVPEYYAKDEKTLAHEIAHAQGVKAIANPNAKQKPIVKRLEKLYAHVKNVLDEREKTEKYFRMPYGVTNVQEFFSEGIANPEFQYILSRIKYENSTAWDKFVEAVANLLGLKADNAFTEFLQIYSDITQGAPKAEGAKPRGRPAKPTTPEAEEAAAKSKREQTLAANQAARAVAAAEKKLAGALAPIPKNAPQMARKDAEAAKQEAVNELYALSRRNRNKPGQRAAEALKNPKITQAELDAAKAAYEKQRALPSKFPSEAEEKTALADTRTVAQIDKEVNKAIDDFETSATATDLADNVSLAQSLRDFDKFKSYFKGLYDKLDGARLSSVLFFMTNDTVAEWGGSYVPELKNTNKLLRQMRTMSRNLLEGAQRVSEEVQRAIAEDPSLKRKLERITSVATDVRVDPARDRRSAKLNEYYNGLGVKGQALYRKLRDYYADVLSTYELLLDSQIDEANLPPGGKQVLMAEIKKMYEADKKIVPFFPFVRNRGDMWLQVGKGQGRQFYTFANEAERQTVMDYIAKEMKSTTKELLADQVFVKGDTLESFRKATSDMTQSIKKVFDKIDDSVDPKEIVGRVAALTNVFKKQDPSLTDEQARAQAYEQAKDEATRDVKNTIYEMYLLTLPDQNFRRGFIARRDIPGYNVDLIRNFSTYAVKTSSQLPRVKYGPKLRNSLRASEKSLDGDPDASKKMRFVNAMTRRVDLELNPYAEPAPGMSPTLTKKIDQTVDFFTRLSFVHYLSAGASAIVQATGFLYGMSTLGARYGYARTAAELAKMTPIWNEFGVSRTNDDGSVTFQVPSIINSKSVTTSPMEKRFVRDMMGAGIGEYTLTSEMLNRGRVSTAAFEGRGSKLGRGTMMVLGGPFQTIERLVQETLAIMAFRLGAAEAKRKGLTGEELYQAATDKALTAVYDSVGNMAESNRPPILRNAWGRLLMQFMLQPMFITTRWMREAYRTVTATGGAAKYQAFKELSGIMGVTWMLAGVAGLPFFSTILGYIGAWLEDEDEKMGRKTFKDLDYWTWWRTVWLPEYMGKIGIYGKPLTDVVGMDEKQLAALFERGPANMLTGVDISSRTSINPTDMFSGQNKEVRTTKEGALQFAEDRAGPSVSMVLSYMDAYDAFADGDIQRGMEKMLPAIARNPVIAFKYYNEGVKDFRGSTILSKDSMTTGRILYQAIGFRIDEVSNQQKFNFAVSKIENKIRFEREDILKNLRDSHIKKDFGRYRDWMDKARKFNAHYPSYAIDDDAIVRSLEGGYERKGSAVRGFVPTEQNMPLFRDAVLKRAEAMREVEERTKK